MKVNGWKTESVQVEISPHDVLINLREAWMGRLRKGDWIDANGFWENEYHTSHSYTERAGKATDEEIEIWKAFQVVMKVTSEMEKTR